MIEEPDYKEFCPMCEQGPELWGLWLSPNGNYWHTVDGYPQHRCKASELRKAYHDYRMKYIDAPLIQACKLRGNREES
jgi:hypothetical protein